MEVFYNSGDRLRTSKLAMLQSAHSMNHGESPLDQTVLCMLPIHGTTVCKNLARRVSPSRCGDSTDSQYQMFPNQRVSSGVRAGSPSIQREMCILQILAISALLSLTRMETTLPILVPEAWTPVNSMN